MHVVLRVLFVSAINLTSPIVLATVLDLDLEAPGSVVVMAVPRLSGKADGTSEHRRHKLA